MTRQSLQFCRPAALAAALALAAACDADQAPLATPAQAQTNWVGVNLVVYHQHTLEPALAAVNRAADMGFNSIQFVTPMFQSHAASPAVRRIIEPWRGPPDEQLLTLMRHARSRGLRTSLMPQIILTEPRKSDWRGKIAPPDWDAWWQSYVQTIDQFLDIARDADADLFILGCELVSTQTGEHAPRWRQLIDDARRRFDGSLSYSANWDAYDDITFWRQLDLIGISGYWELAAGYEHQGPARRTYLLARWDGIRESLRAFADEHDRPILLTEFGYPSLSWALQHPWNYVNEDDTPADLAAQAEGYELFLQAWSDELRPGRSAMSDERAHADPFAGVLFYEWDLHRQPDPSDDTGYSFVGKPAEQLLRAWLQGQ